MTISSQQNVLEALLKKENLKALIVEAPLDLYYLTGCDVSAGVLLITNQAVTFFVDGRYEHQCKALSIYPVTLSKNFASNSSFHEALKKIEGTIGFDSQTTSHARFLELSTLHSPTAHLKPLISPIKFLRQIKSPEEIVSLRQAALLNTAGVNEILSKLKEGISEEELAQKLEIYWRKKGGEKCAFSPIIAFGENSALPHYRAGKRKLKKGDLILIDCGVVKNHYHSDMTRVFGWKEESPFFSSIYLIVYKAVQAALKLCRPGAKISSLDAAARKVIEEAGYSNHFPHSLGHGLGLETHELPNVRTSTQNPDAELEAGMVITIEPGLYFPEQGGIRLEETIEITSEGYSLITTYPLSPQLQILGTATK